MISQEHCTYLQRAYMMRFEHKETQQW
jgi:hypothetical protein